MTTLSPWQAGMQAANDEATGGGRRGAFDVEVIRLGDMAGLKEGMRAGDPDSLRVGKVVHDTLRNISGCTADQPAICGSCPDPLRPGEFSIVACIPAVPNPTTAFGMAIYTKCATEPAELLAKAGEALRRIWPDARPLTVTNPEGGQA